MVTNPLQSSGPRGGPVAGAAGFGSIYQHSSFREACSELALSRLSARAGLFVLLGGARVGKSTLISHFVQTLPAGERVVAVECWREMTRRDLLIALAGEGYESVIFAEDDSGDGLVEPDLGLSQDMLAELQRTTAVLDSAELAPDLVLEFAYKLRFEESSVARLHNLILVGDLELEDRLASPRLRMLNSTVLFKALLKPMAEDEVETFIASRLKGPDSEPSFAFDDVSIARIAKATGGVPQEVDWVCLEAVRIAKAVPTRKINLTIVNKAIVRRQTIGLGATGGSREERVVVADPHGHWPPLPDFDLEPVEGKSELGPPTPLRAVPLADGSGAPRRRSSMFGKRALLVGMAAALMIFLAVTTWLWLTQLRNDDVGLVADVQGLGALSPDEGRPTVSDGNSLGKWDLAPLSEDLVETEGPGESEFVKVEPEVDDIVDGAAPLTGQSQDPEGFGSIEAASDPSQGADLVMVEPEAETEVRSGEPTGEAADRPAARLADDPQAVHEKTVAAETPDPATGARLDRPGDEAAVHTSPGATGDLQSTPETSVVAEAPPPPSSTDLDDAVAAAKRAEGPTLADEQSAALAAEEEQRELDFLASLSEVKMRQVQEALTVLQFDPGPIDGVAGSQTRQAITAFEQSIARGESDKPSPMTVERLIQLADNVRADWQSRLREQEANQKRISVASQGSISQLSGLAEKAQRKVASRRIRNADESPIQWLQRLARSGDTKAQTNLAQRYYHGNGVSRDPSKAAQWYQRAANQGDSTAQTNLGLLYFKGDGVPMDRRRAAKLSLEASLQGHATAQMNLGLMYQHGSGVEKDLRKAVHWFRKASAAGEPGAEAALRDALAKGGGETE